MRTRTLVSANVILPNFAVQHAFLLCHTQPGGRLLLMPPIDFGSSNNMHFWLSRDARELCYKLKWLANLHFCWTI